MNEAQLVLAQTMWGEARGEGDEGMRAVANVVMNRTALGGWWGDEVIAVCKKPWQFSAWNANDPNRPRMEKLRPGGSDAEQAAFERAYVIAGRAIAGDLPDVTGGATHYHAPSVNPAWASSLTYIGKIGAHTFYREA